MQLFSHKISEEEEEVNEEEDDDKNNEKRCIKFLSLKGVPLF